MFCSLSVCLDVICVWTEALTFHMDILKYLCLNYSHVPSFCYECELAAYGGQFCTQLRIHSFWLYSVFYVSVFLDRKGVSNDGQMSQFIRLVSLLTKWTSRGRFFLTFSVKLYRIFNEVMYSFKKKKKERSAILSSNITLNETLYTFGAPLYLPLYS